MFGRPTYALQEMLELLPSVPNLERLVLESMVPLLRDQNFPPASQDQLYI
jgi:hypothetical protein